MSRVFLILALLSIINIGYCQINGQVLDENGEPLPYASIFIETTNNGTVTNENGIYKLDTELKGNLIISCQFIGYQKQSKEINLQNKPVNIDFNLQLESYVIDELTVFADAEDPAYQIIRNAIKAKKINNSFPKHYEADMYIKGVIKVVDAPEKFLGQDIGNMGGILDSAKNGVLYLSESKSKIQYLYPNKWKEEMYASKVSGQDVGLSFNNYTQAQFNFYNEYLEFERSFISPLNDNCFDYYEFIYEGASYDNKVGVNKIKVIPKSDNIPMFVGYIYITENSWAISSVDLTLTGKSMKDELLDSLQIIQFHRQTNDGKYFLKDQTMRFKAHIFNFKLGGYFVYSFTDIDFEKVIDHKYFNNEIFVQKLDDKLQNETYWDTIRPVPLLIEEKKDYIKKDSLAIVWKSKEYRDSIDQKNNKFGVLNLIFGYSYRNSYRHKSFSFSAPINTVQFNAVEGFKLNTEMKYTIRDPEKNHFSQLLFKPQIGFSDNKFKFDLGYTNVFNAKENGMFNISIGRSLKHFDNRFSFLESWNSLLSLFCKENETKIYSSEYLKLSINGEISNSISIFASVMNEKRNAVKVNTQYSFFDKDKIYESNDFPLPSDVNEDETSDGGLIFTLNLNYKPSVKVYNFERFKVKELSGWPRFSVGFEKAIPAFGGNLDFDKIKLGIDWDYINLNLKGHSRLNLRYGKFLTRQHSSKIDRFHFDGTLSSLYDINNNNLAFLRMPVYLFSSNEDYFKIHWKHHFNGYILDRIPILKNSGLKTVVGFSYLTLKNERDYYETSFGFENVGIGPFKLFNIEYAWQYAGKRLFDHGFVIGIRKGLF